MVENIYNNNNKYGAIGGFGSSRLWEHRTYVEGQNGSRFSFDDLACR